MAQREHPAWIAAATAAAVRLAAEADAEVDDLLVHLSEPSAEVLAPSVTRLEHSVDATEVATDLAGLLWAECEDVPPIATILEEPATQAALEAVAEARRQAALRLRSAAVAVPPLLDLPGEPEPTPDPEPTYADAWRSAAPAARSTIWPSGPAAPPAEATAEPTDAVPWPTADGDPAVDPWLAGAEAWRRADAEAAAGTGPTEADAGRGGEADPAAGSGPTYAHARRTADADPAAGGAVDEPPGPWPQPERGPLAPEAAPVAGRAPAAPSGPGSRPEGGGAPRPHPPARGSGSRGPAAAVLAGAAAAAILLFGRRLRRA